jgi:[ribosomal protein S5]-alanine N-acetyltransferase
LKPRAGLKSGSDPDFSDAAGLTTARLTLRRFTPGDLDWFARLMADEEVKRRMGGPSTRDQAERAFRERCLDYYDQHPGLGQWITIERATGTPIGLHLLNNIQGETDIQVGYVLDVPFWGRGYATEMCIALLRYGFTRMKLPRIVGIVNLENPASQRVLLKSGLHRNGERAFGHAAYAAAGPMAFFERHATDWLAEFGAT